MREMQPVFSVIIPTYNRRASLRRCLDSLARQEGEPGFEVIVVDDGSTDGTLDMLARSRFPYPLHVRTIEHAGPAAARNRGAEEAVGEYLLFVDDDVVAHPELIAVHAAAHESEADAVVIGLMAPPLGERLPSWARWEQEVLDKQYRAMRDGIFKASPRQFYTANASLARRHFASSAGFDPEYRRAEDVELAYRLRDMGLRFVFREDAVVTHYAHRSIRSWCMVPYQYGVYDVRMAKCSGRRFILGVISREFRRRHVLARWLTSLLVGRWILARALALGLVAVGVGAGTVSFGVARSAYSLAFNLLYFQGLCDGLGSATTFRQLLADDSFEPVLEPGRSTR